MSYLPDKARKESPMNSKSAKLVMRVGIVLVLLLLSDPLRAEDPQATLSGAVTDHTGRVLPDVKVSVKNLANGQLVETHTNSDGLYTVSNLAPGDYEVSVSVPEGTKLAQVTLAAGGVQRADLVLNAVPSPAEAPGATRHRRLPATCRMPLPVARPSLRLLIWVFLPSRPKETRNSRRCSTSGRTC
jgi:hypothetical protein